MSNRRTFSSSETCPVCHEDVEIYAVGQCDHPVCFRCCTRMRVLSDQMYCPICRTDLPKVIFIKGLREFGTVNTNKFLINRKHRIYFEDTGLQEAYNSLLEHKCSICKDRKPAKTLNQLSDHLRRDHQLFFCDLCLKHLKIFPQERHVYTRKDLALHRRQGDANDTSHKGHPLCKFCDERYLDNDELVRHLRKDHFYCHICDADGSNEYFSDYCFLRDHFMNSHFLCEEGDCIDAQFTNAFRSDIDLKAHISTSHTKSMKKAAMKQARTIDIEINYPRRDRNTRGKISGEDFEIAQNDVPGEKYTRGRGQGSRGRREHYDTERAIGNSLRDVIAQKKVQLLKDEEARTETSSSDSEGQAKDEPKKEFSVVQEDFPMPDGSDGPTELIQSTVSDTMANSLALSVGKSVKNTHGNEKEFPSLGNPSSKTKSHPQHAWMAPGSKREDDFPGLPSSNRKGTKQSSMVKLNKADNYPGSSNKNGTAAANSFKSMVKSISGNKEEDFPGLSSSNRRDIKDRSNLMVTLTSKNKSDKSQKAYASSPPSSRRAADTSNTSDYPGLPQHAKNITTNMQNTKYQASQNKTKPKALEDDYPSLPTSSRTEVLHINKVTVIPAKPSEAMGKPFSERVSASRRNESFKSLKEIASSVRDWDNDFPSLNDNNPVDGSTGWVMKPRTKPANKQNKSKLELAERKVHSAFEEIPGLCLEVKESKKIKSDVKSDKIKQDKPRDNNIKGGTAKNEKIKHNDSLESQIVTSSEKVTVNIEKGVNDLQFDKKKEIKPDNILITEETDLDLEWKKVPKSSSNTNNKKAKKKKNKKQEIDTLEKETSSVVLDYVDSLENADPIAEISTETNIIITDDKVLPSESKKRKKKAKSKKSVQFKEIVEDSEMKEDDTIPVEELLGSSTAVDEVKQAPVDEDQLGKLVMLSIHDRTVEETDPVQSNGNITIDLENEFPVLESSRKVPPGLVQPKAKEKPTFKENKTADFLPDFINIEALAIPGLKDISTLLLDDVNKMAASKSKQGPPPGFVKRDASSGLQKPSVVKNPPPGFSTPVSPTPVSPTPVSPTPPVPTSDDVLNVTYVYTEPSNFAQRNQKLIIDIQNYLSNKEDDFGKFKVWSGMFRKDMMPASDYYANCQDLLRSEKFSKVFPDLLTLLPDIDKQNELLDVHLALTRTRLIKSSASSKKGNLASWFDPQFSQCSLCRQVMYKDDMLVHMEHHGEGDEFPKLASSNTNPLGLLNNWAKKYMNW